jgi:hypothetical protein
MQKIPQVRAKQEQKQQQVAKTAWTSSLHTTLIASGHEPAQQLLIFKVL